MGRSGLLRALLVALCLAALPAAAAQQVEHDYYPFLRRVATSRTGLGSCGPPSSWDCVEGQMQAYLIMAHASLYRQTGDQTFLDVMHGYADHASSAPQTGAGPPGDWSSGEKDHGFYMAGYALAYLAEPDAGKKAAYGTYLDNFANAGSIDAGTPGGGQNSNDHSAMVIGYSMAYGATKSGTVKGYFGGFGLNECNGYDCGYGRTHGEFMLGFAEAYLASGEGGYKSKLDGLASTLPSNANLGCTSSHDCRESEYQDLMLLGEAKAYEISGTASFKDRVVGFANTRPSQQSCGPPGAWYCGDAKLQGFSLLAYAKAYLLTNDAAYLGYLKEMGRIAQTTRVCSQEGGQVMCGPGTGVLMLGLQVLSSLYPYFGEAQTSPAVAATDKALTVSVPVGDLPKTEVLAGYFGRFDLRRWQQGVASCDCWLEGTKYPGCLAASGAEARFEVPSPPAGNRTFRVACTNKAGFSNTLTSWVVVYPDGILLERDDVAYVNKTSYTVRVNYTSSTAVACSASLAGPGGSSSPAVSGGGSNVGKLTVPLSLSTDGSYTFDLSCTNAGGKAASFRLSFVADNAAPALTLSAQQGYDARPITLGASGISDATAGVASCRLLVDGQARGDRSPSGGAVSWTIDLPEASYELKVCCSDRAGNEGCRSIVSKVDLTPSATPTESGYQYRATATPSAGPSATPAVMLTPTPAVTFAATPVPTPSGPCEPPSNEAIRVGWAAAGGALASLETASKRAVAVVPALGAKWNSTREEAAALMRAMNAQYLANRCDVASFLVSFTAEGVSFSTTRSNVEFLEAGQVSEAQFLAALQEHGPTPPPAPTEEPQAATAAPSALASATAAAGAQRPASPTPLPDLGGFDLDLATPTPTPTPEPTGAQSGPPEGPGEVEPVLVSGGPVPTLLGRATATPRLRASARPSLRATAAASQGATLAPAVAAEELPEVSFAPEMKTEEREAEVKKSLDEALGAIAATQAESQGADTQEAESFLKLAEEKMASGELEEAVRYAWVAKKRADEVGGRKSVPWRFVRERQRSSLPIDPMLALLLGGALAAMAAGVALLLRSRQGGADPEIVRYIDERRAEGFEDEEIVHTLLDSGYDEDEIYRAFGIEKPKEPRPEGGRAEAEEGQGDGEVVRGDEGGEG